jgi:hypothetical protein
MPLPVFPAYRKVADEDEINNCHDAIATVGGSRELPVIAIVESARGVLNCPAIALGAWPAWPWDGSTWRQTLASIPATALRPWHRRVP